MSIVHVHLLLNHVPVIGALLGSAILAYALIRRNSEVAKLSFALFCVLALVAVAVFFTGEPAEEAIERLAGISSAITEQHEELAQVSTIALVSFGVLALAALAYYRRKQLPRWAAAAGLGVSLTISGLMAATANLGGQIRHSEIRAAPSPPGDDSHDRGAEEPHR